MARKMRPWSSPTISTRNSMHCTAATKDRLGCDRPAWVIDLTSAGSAYCAKHATKKHIRKGWGK